MHAKKPTPLPQRRLDLGKVGALCAAALALVWTDTSLAQSVTLAGREGNKAVLVVDGKAYTVGVGEHASGVRFLRWAGNAAEVKAAGQVLALSVGATGARMSAAASPGNGAREIVLTAGPGGHFKTMGSVNNRPVQFVVDTGATLVAMGRDEAQRLGIDLSKARTGLSETANGTVQIHLVTLASVRVGEVEVLNVGASVLPQPLPYLLLGNSFLTRFQMQRHNDEMRLQLR